MQKIRLLSVTALTLPLLLAACGQSAVPAQIVPAASLVKVRVNSQGLSRTFGAAALHTQGLPSDGHGGLPDMQMKVTVRDGQGAMVAFKDGTYDPSGQGDRTLTLNAQNAFGTTLYLPQGTYSFENATTDAGGTNTLLAYGPSTENVQLVDTDHPNVMLKFHAVLDVAQSKLDFATNTQSIYTNYTFNLRLYAKSSPVNGVAYDIPASDLKLAAPAYTLGSEVGMGGTINGTGSALGVNVTATDAATMSVTSHIQAWLRNPGTDTASFQDVSLPAFQHQIDAAAAGGVQADVTPPNNVTLTVPQLVQNGVQNSVQNNASVTLTGTARDDVQVQYLRLYADQNLVASTDPADTDAGVPTLTTDLDGNWSAVWTPMTLGKHELMLLATDSSGNERKAVQTVISVKQTTLPLTYNNGYYQYASSYLTLAPNADLWVKVDLSGCGYCQQYDRVEVSVSGNYTDILNKISFAAASSLNGPEASIDYPFAYSYPEYAYSYSGKIYHYQPYNYVHLVNNTELTQEFSIFVGY